MMKMIRIDKMSLEEIGTKKLAKHYNGYLRGHSILAFITKSVNDLPAMTAPIDNATLAKMLIATLEY